MFDIVRRYTEDVEEYSIDECFADLTGLRRSGTRFAVTASCRHDVTTLRRCCAVAF
jgi:nucleotidyltransferase/DNA polymerase involved in DNA repair